MSRIDATTRSIGDARRARGDLRHNRDTTAAGPRRGGATLGP